MLAGAVLAATAASLVLWLPAALRPREPEVVFLSVGTADSALLRSESGNALVDTGWSGSQAVRALQQSGERLDAVIVTHADADHAGGLQNVLESVEVGAVYLPLGMSRTAVADALAVAEGEASFGDGSVYMEKYVHPARHIEVQVLADECVILTV